MTRSRSSVLLPSLCADPHLLPSLREYARVAFLSYSVQTVLSGFTSFVRVSGRPVLVSNSVVVSCVLNIALDLVFIKGFGMGLVGGSMSAGSCWANATTGRCGRWSGGPSCC